MYKKIELDLLAIGLYLNGIEDKQEVEAIKLELSRKIFGRFDLVEKSKNTTGNKDDIGVSICNINSASKFIKEHKDTIMSLFK